jgi:hypothetical protein
MALLSEEGGASVACWAQVIVTVLNADAGTPTAAAVSEAVPAEALPLPGEVQNAHATMADTANANANASVRTIFRLMRGRLM